MSFFTKTIYALLFLALLFQPHFAKHIGIIPKPYVESVITAAILGIAYMTYYLNKRQVRKQADRLKVYDRRISELKHTAFHDSLTGLPNRLLLKDRIAAAISRAKRYNQQVAVLFMDLDKFKYINDAFGHKIGDLLLKEVARRLSENIRGIDTVARLGGDEFVIVLNEVNSLGNVITITDNIMLNLQPPYRLEHAELPISASIGISLYPDHGEHEDLLLKNADHALYQVKRSGGKNYQFYLAN
jgi:diguanylate cyclase